MIGLDTNVIVRYLVRDDPRLSPIAVDLLERQLTKDEPGFVSIVAVTETSWVLERSYRMPRPQVADALERILRADNIVVESEAEVFEALTALKLGRGRFADWLIAALNRRAGCTVTFSFDRRALRIPGFQRP